MARTLVAVAAGAVVSLVLAVLGVVALVALGTVDGERGDFRCQQALLAGLARESEAPPVLRSDGWSWRPLGIRCEVVNRDDSRRHDVVRPW